MKSNKYISVIITASVLTISGCNSLEQPPINQYTDANYWNEERAEFMVNSAYAAMYNAGRMWDDVSMGDDVINGRSTNNPGRLIKTGQATASTSRFNGEWDSMYTGIKFCHLFLDNIANIDVKNPEKISRLTAEARFVRAYLFFRLATLYGDVPFFTHDILSSEARTIGKTSKEEIIGFVRDELEDIIQVLPKRDDLTKEESGRITKGAAVMLLARTWLYENNWAEVERLTGLLIDRQDEYGSYCLFPSYRGLFEEENEYNSEVILDRAFVPNFITWSDIQDMIPLSRDGRVSDRVPVQALVDCYLTTGGYAIDEEGTDYDPGHPYDNRDPRMTATVIYDGYDWEANVNDWFPTKGNIEINPATSTTEDAYAGPNSNGSVTGYYLRKWYAPQSKGSASSGLNLIMMRYADVLLMNAEAALEQGRLDETVWNRTIRPIRQRAGFTADRALDFPSGKTQDELRKIVRNERRCELAIEGLRYFDIMRWDIGAEVFSGEVQGAYFTDHTGIFLKHIPERNYLWAIPQSEIDLNENLKPQNPGY